MASLVGVLRRRAAQLEANKEWISDPVVRSKLCSEYLQIIVAAWGPPPNPEGGPLETHLHRCLALASAPEVVALPGFGALRGVARLRLAMLLMLYGGDCLVAKDLLFASEEETKQARIAADISPAAANLTLALIDCALAQSLYGLSLLTDSLTRNESANKYWSGINGGRGKPSVDEMLSITQHTMTLNDLGRVGEAEGIIDAASARVGKATDPQSCAMMGALQFMRRTLGNPGVAGVRDSLAAARARLTRATACIRGGGVSDLVVARAEAYTVVCFLEEAGSPREVLAAIAEYRALGGGQWADAGGCKPELGVRAAELRALSALGLHAEFDAAIAALDEWKRGNLAVCAGPGCGHQGSQPEPGALSRCGGCGRAAYCSAACQRAAWKGHKGDCKVSVRAARASGEVSAVLAVGGIRVDSSPGSMPEK